MGTTFSHHPSLEHGGTRVRLPALVDRGRRGLKHVHTQVAGLEHMHTQAARLLRPQIRLVRQLFDIRPKLAISEGSESGVAPGSVEIVRRARSSGHHDRS